MIKDRIVVGLDIPNDELRGEIAAIVVSVSDMRLQTSEDTGYPDLLIMEIDDDHDKTFSRLQSMLASAPATEVFLTASRTDPDALLQAIRAGIKEFIRQPLQAQELHQAFMRFIERHQQHKAQQAVSGKVLNVIGGKGGVGTTTVAVNLAAGLLAVDNQLSVALVDLNSQFGDISLFLDLAPAHTFGSVTKNIARLDATFLAKALTQHACGLHVLPSATDLEEMVALMPESVVKTLEMLADQFDYVVVDSGHLLDAITISALQTASANFLVTALTLPVLRSTKRFLDIVFDLGYDNDNIRIIANRGDAKKVSVTLDDLEKVINREVYWSIPNDYLVSLNAINRGLPIPVLAKRATISKSFIGLGRLIHQGQENRTSHPSRRKGWLSR
jgi:pilus assembly protein CpaE